MYVIGTAGHVDHGKSSLVLALTGIDPDRLKEEKAREMTIDLGFAWLNLPDLGVIGVVDVPGHRDFIENMLAGVGGIDAVLFVVAADEGIMPQTREHLAILDLLEISGGVVALTKTDLVPDADWLGLIQLELAEVLRGTLLENAPIIPVSARQGTGLAQLLAALTDHLKLRPIPIDLGRPRLWIDRVFTVSGFGTVVTGTLLEGRLRVGDEVMLYPTHLTARIRGLQSHHHKIEWAAPGSRVAVNLAGLQRDQVRRGMLLALPSAVQVSDTLTVRLKHLRDAPRPLKHNAEVKFFCGTAESLARVRLLSGDSLEVGTQGWLQLQLRDPLPISQGDRFILRYPSPGDTLGGGRVVDPRAVRLKRGRAEVIRQLEARSNGTPEQVIAAALFSAAGPRHTDQLVAESGFSADEIRAVLGQTPSAIALDDDWWISAEALKRLEEMLVRKLEAFHRSEPLQVGIRPEGLRNALQVEEAALKALLAGFAARGILKRDHGLLSLSQHSIKWTRAQQANIAKLRALVEAAPYTPPSPREAAALVGEDVLTALIGLGEFRQIAADVILTPPVYAEMIAAVRETLAESGRVSVKVLRDRFKTSRKYALGVLEYLNELGITRREGDEHVLASGRWELAE